MAYVSPSGLRVVPYPRTDGMGWGFICPDHVLWMGDGPTDRTWGAAADFADACQCAHPEHKR
jgi:hypothetical protein